MMQENAADHSSNSVLLNTFVVKKKRCRVYFHRGTLIWETERPPYSKRDTIVFCYFVVRSQALLKAAKGSRL